MDKDEIRTLIREEIALAMKTLEDEALNSFNSYAYKGACEATDAKRAGAAKNPFEESAPTWDEITERLRGIRESLRESNGRPEHIDALDRLIKGRLVNPATCDHTYPWIHEGVASTHCKHCGTVRPF